jgi:hypothetical protein
VSDDWDFYLCRVDDEPASIFLDLGIATDAPRPDRPIMAHVRLYLREPRPDGLSSNTEFGTLSRLEDHLTRAVTAGDAAVYVGRNTSGGCRDFYFYVAEDGDWGEQVGVALAAFPAYRYETGSRPDPDWSIYFEFLHPSAEDMQRIRNRRVCDALRSNGDALTEPRAIDHWAFFPDEASRERFVQTIGGLGFLVREMESQADSEGSFVVQVFRDDVPALESIDDVTLPLHRAAVEHGGYYDGWETQVIR